MFATAVKLVAYVRGAPVKAVMLDGSTGFLTQTTRVRGKLHDDGIDAAVIERDPITNLVLRRMFYQHGTLHRDTGPAYIEYSPASGHMTLEVFCRHGRLDYSVAGAAAVDYEARTGQRLRYDLFRPGSPPIADARQLGFGQAQ